MYNDRSHNVYGYKNARLRKQRRMIVILCILICVISIVCVIVLVRNMMDRGQSPTSPSLTDAPPVTSNTSLVTDPSVSDSSQVTEPTPLPSVQTLTAEERSAALDALEQSIVTLLDAQAGRYSVFYVNLENNETLGYQDSSPMVAASSIKIAYNTYLYKQSATGAFTLDEMLKYNSTAYPDGDFEAGTGTIQNTANGTEYSLRDLSSLSIKISDNCATNMILRYLGGIDAVNEYMTSISSIVNYRVAVSYTDYAGTAQSGRHRTSAIDLAMYAKDLYDLYQASPDVYAALIEDMSTSEFQWGIPAGVPDNYRVAHKVGFNPSYGTNNDVGIVFAQEDYVLCVMTESGNGTGAQNLIGQVSQLVSDYITACYS
jgi:beta-lactamase class A